MLYGLIQGTKSRFKINLLVYYPYHKLFVVDIMYIFHGRDTNVWRDTDYCAIDVTGPQ